MVKETSPDDDGDVDLAELNDKGEPLKLLGERNDIIKLLF